MTKKKLTIVLLILMLFVFCVSVQASYGNDWILDEAQVVSEETEEYIRYLNEELFPAYQNKPQLGVMIIENLPVGYTMDEYKLEQFNLYGVGTKEENCGMLFVLAINDRQYGLEIGDGFQKGSFLRKDLKKAFISSDIKTMLQEENYDGAILKIAEHLEGIMTDEENGVYAEKEAQYLIWQQRQTAKMEEITQMAKVIVLAVLVGVGCVALFGFIKAIIQSYRIKKKIWSLLDINYKYVALLKTDEKTLAKNLHSNESWTWNDYKYLEDNFLKYLHKYYIGEQRELLNTKELKYHISEYQERLKNTNTLEVFSTLDVKDIDTIIYETEQELHCIEEIRKQSYEKIHNFICKNSEQITNKAISINTLEAEMQKYCVDGEVLSDEKIEVAFTKELNELNFKCEFDKFIEENKDNIDGKYFRSNEFYDTLRRSPEFSSYRYSPTYSRTWMMPLLMTHMNHRKHEVKRQEEERAAAARRRQQAIREQQTRSSYSSFGGGFGGGHSSGGGFSGKW